jgi:TPR repeat protein
MRSLVVVPVLALLIGCPGNPVGPDGAGPGTSDAIPPEPGQTLVVDMGDAARTSLEANMKSNVIVVAYDPNPTKPRFDFLFDCTVDGSYGFIGTTTRSRVVKLQKEQDIGANLPLSAINPVWRVNASAEIKRGGSIDIAYFTVGQKATTRTSVSRSMLKGSCDGATHFVRAVTIGAFAVAKTGHDERKSAIDVFGIAAHANGSATASDQKTDGDPNACSSASPDADKPPPQCGAPIHIRLLKIDSKNGSEVRVDDQPCPAGFGRADDGTCTQGGPHECRMADPSDCEAQCGTGNAASCGILGYLKQYGERGVAKDEGAARGLYKKACDGGAQFGCAGLGVFFAMEGNFAEATKLFKVGCDAGNARACGNLGASYGRGEGVEKDEGRALQLFKKACGGGDANACANLGRGLQKSGDMAGAKRAYKQACDGGEQDGCSLGAQ